MNIDHKKARLLLMDAFQSISRENYAPSSPFRDFVKRVMFSSHKTFRYILVTALLAKTTDAAANPLALQAGAPLPGAYDARSLCHSVLVPFEREFLSNSLGGSNEPYLNKPARFTHLSKDNAVRGGKDKEILDLLCDELPKITSSNIAFHCLCDSLYYAIQSHIEYISFSSLPPKKSPGHSEIEDFISDFVSKSFEGETLALAVGGLFNLLLSLQGPTLDVRVHPVNQSGASSREICDIDVYMNNKIIYGAEVKDKNFFSHDVQHAVTKIRQSGCGRLIFIMGPHAQLLEDSEQNLKIQARSNGVYLTFFSISDFSKAVLSLIPTLDSKLFVESLRTFALHQKFKVPTLAYLKNLTEKYGWL